MTEHLDQIPDDLPTCQERLRAVLERLHDLERQLHDMELPARRDLLDDRGAAAFLRVPEGRIPGAEATVLRAAPGTTA